MQSSLLIFAVLALGASDTPRQPHVRVTGDGAVCTLSVNGKDVSNKAEIRATIGSRHSVVLDTDERTPKDCIIETILLRLSPELYVSRIRVNGRPGYTDIVPLEHREGQFDLLRQGGGLGVFTDDTVSFAIMRGDHSARWLVSRYTTDTNWCGRREGNRCVQTRTHSHAWIDGRTCSALNGVIARLDKVRLAERGSSHDIISDTPLTSLVTWGAGGMRAERLSEYEGPLVDWWQSSSKELQHCWTDNEPSKR